MFLVAHDSSTLAHGGRRGNHELFELGAQSLGTLLLQVHLCQVREADEIGKGNVVDRIDPISASERRRQNILKSFEGIRHTVNVAICEVISNFLCAANLRLGVSLPCA